MLTLKKREFPGGSFTLEFNGEVYKVVLYDENGHWISAQAFDSYPAALDNFRQHVEVLKEIESAIGKDTRIKFAGNRN